MKKTLLLPQLGLLAFVSACAGEGGAVTEPGAYVEIADVIESSHVQPVDGITASGQPDVAALQVFADSGYVAIVDMRGLDEDRGMDDEKGIVEGLGLEYVAFPIDSADEITFDKARELDELIRSYDGPVLVHCASSNRVGAVLALRHSLNGASDEEALQYGRDGGLTRLEPVVVQRLSEK
jgi:uncharacterized protein (TIGR01244 family)